MSHQDEIELIFRKLVSQASATGVPPETIETCAYILAQLKFRQREHEIGDQHAEQNRARTLAEIHGVDGELNLIDAKAIEAKASTAAMNICSSAIGVILSLQQYEKTCKDYLESVPWQLRKLAHIERVTELRKALAEDTQKGGMLYNYGRKKPKLKQKKERSFTSELLGYWAEIAENEKYVKREDLYTLARAWHLTNAKNVLSFARMIRRAQKADKKNG